MGVLVGVGVRVGAGVLVGVADGVALGVAVGVEKGVGGTLVENARVGSSEILCRFLKLEKAVIKMIAVMMIRTQAAAMSVLRDFNKPGMGIFLNILFNRIATKNDGAQYSAKTCP